ncbi:SPOR domain-containing protein [Alginatibacterium sediminis]|nr:SPOR domain-containing protein [Alginatibacterium sediminis]
MANQLQNRLIGTIVLVALVVIFIPDLLDGQKERVAESFNSIPFAPERRELAPLVIELDPQSGNELPSSELVSVDVSNSPDSKQVSKTAPSESNSTVQQVEKPAKPLVVKTAPESPSIPVSTKVQAPIALDKPAYIIQLGAFKNAENVVRLVSQLRAAGYQAHSMPPKPIDGEVNRVFVGPDIDSKKLNDKLEDLKQLTKLNGKVVRFDPLEQ